MYFRFLPMICVMGIIFFLSHTPGDNLPSAIEGLDKLCHGIAYGVLAASFLYAVKPQVRDRSPMRTALAVFLFCFLYGVSDEFHQSFIAGRFSDRRDIVADICGAGLVVLLWLWRRRTVQL